jgi:hypothetical protein
VNDLAYASGLFPVRADLADAHRRILGALVRPGRWLDGRTRVALAAEARAARDCALCTARKAALSPVALQGRHDGVSDLPAHQVELAHRLATDPGRLSRAFYEQARAGGLEDGEYVEAVGVVARAVALDAFCRALGLPPHPLPAPEPGAPARVRPAGLGEHGAWVPTLPPDYGPWVGRALSLEPEGVAAMKALLAAQYVPFERVPDVEFSERTLSRAQMELLAGRVSALNECFY